MPRAGANPASHPPLKWFTSQLQAPKYISLRWKKVQNQDTFGLFLNVTLVGTDRICIGADGNDSEITVQGLVLTVKNPRIYGEHWFCYHFLLSGTVIISLLSQSSLGKQERKFFLLQWIWVVKLISLKILSISCFLNCVGWIFMLRPVGVDAFNGTGQSLSWFSS